jgi:hypothetical protein
MLIKESQETEILLLCRKVVFMYLKFGWSGFQILESIKFSAKTGFNYAQSPFKTRFTVLDKVSAIRCYLLN